MTALKALDYFKNNQKQFLDQLISLVKIPSVSFDGFDPTNVQKSAEYTAQLLKDAGLQNVELLKMPETNPYVYADWLHAPGKPTLLLYAHHDVQPPMDESRWKSKPFEPEVRDGRLYGRGAADDKAGVLIHVASIASFLKSSGKLPPAGAPDVPFRDPPSAAKLPVNVKVIIEGEEEIGSHHLPEFLEKYKKKLSADVMVLTDLANFDTGLPSLTTSLRGLVAIELTVKSIDHPLHSGLWSGPIPDPNMAMAKILASLSDEDGLINIEGIYKDVLKVRKDELKDFTSLPLNEKIFREQSGMLKKSELVGGKKHLLEKMWRQPSLVVNWLESGSKKTTGNVIMNQSQARIGIRIVPSQSAKKVLKQLTEHIKKVAPWGVTLEFKTEACSDPWVTDTKHPVFKIAKDALTQGYGKEAYFTGCGASIPFVAPFSKALGNIPALLVGIEDPYTNAHGENESLDLGDFEKAIKSQIYLFEKLSIKNF